MKNFKLFLILMLLVFTTQAQTIYIANNNPGAPGGVNTFTGSSALADALIAASNGDIIYLVPSPTNYGNPMISKQLTIYGGGFNPDKDSPEVTLIGTTRLDIAASNVTLSGLTITGIAYTNGNISNIVIEKCAIKQFANNGGAAQGNILIHNNIFGQNIPTNQYVMNFGTISSNIIISNNIIYHNQSNGFGLINTSNGTTVENNIFIGPSSGTTVSAFDNFNFGTVKTISSMGYSLCP
ncbi:MAG: right-handed parallel beta-helix repeat-containing protein [Bacteroidota bacterium]